MKVQLIIPVYYKGKHMEFRGKLLKGEYGFKFKLKVDDVDVVFEQDKEGKYKLAGRPGGALEEKIDRQLIWTIAKAVEEAEE